MALDISEVVGLANASIVKQGKAMQDDKIALHVDYL